MCGTAPPDALLRRSQSRFGGATICGSSKMAPTPLLFTEKGSSMKTFGTAPLKEPEQEPARSLPNRPNKIINKETLSGFLSCVSCLILNSI